jgi:hypothetical protein
LTDLSSELASITTERSATAAAQPARAKGLSRLRPPKHAMWALGLLLVGTVLFFASLGQVELDGMTDIGLASVLPVTTFVALALVTLSFWPAILDGRAFVVAPTVVVLIVVLYGLPIMVEPTLPFQSAWRHAGVVEEIARTGAFDPTIDAYFNWPGFFAFGALLTQAAGFDNAIEYARWTPVVLNLAFLPAVLAIMRTATTSRRLPWIGVHIFFLSNWIGQDYFSPQGVMYLLHLTLLLILLRWFGEVRGGSRLEALAHQARQRLRRTERPARDYEDAPSTTGQRQVLVVVTVALGLVIVVSHQLTPVTTLLCVAALVAVRRSRLRMFPILLGLAIGIWIIYGADTYLVGHPDKLTGQVGAVNQNVGGNVGSRLGGSSGHELIVKERLALTGLLWLLALAGAVLRARRGESNRAFAVLAVAPFGLLLLQPYGGEVLLRVALFALPFVSFFAAGLLYRRGFGPGARAVVPGLLLSLVLLGGFVFARYGNERMVYFSRDEVRATQQLYRIAPPGSVLVSVTPTLPWRQVRYAAYRYRRLTGTKRGVFQTKGIPANTDISTDIGTRDEGLLVRQTAARMRPPGGFPAYIIFTRAQIAELDMFGPWAPGATARAQRILTASPRFKVVYRNKDATILTLTDTPRADGSKP